MPIRHTILVVDDEDFVRESLADLLESEGYRVLSASSPPQALSILGRERVTVVITDLSMPEGTGLDLLADIRKFDTIVPVILLTGVGTVKDAVAAIKGGAYDFIQKPVDPAQVALLIERAIEHRSLKDEIRKLRSAVADLRAPGEFVGVSAWSQELRSIIAQVATSEATVLISGESGTGKELVATEIHRESARSAQNLVKINCAALTDALFESELFGHRAGVFEGAREDRVGRFQEADGGTLLLDEIGNLKPGMQAKLLRFFESGEFQVLGESRTQVVDVRVIALTNEDLEARVKDGTFRSDLYYRLNIFPIKILPLAARIEDISAIARYYLRRSHANRDPSSIIGPMRDLDEQAISVLESYEWPGNARELRNVIERAMILRPVGELDAELFLNILGIGTGRSEADAITGEEIGDNLNLRERIDAMERRLIETALTRAEGRKRDAAELLGIDPKNLGYYIRKHKITGRG